MAKHDYEKKLMRLVSIVSRLNEGEHLSVSELAKEHNVSSRTIQRDFNEKLIHFFPIYQENKKWKIQDGFKIEKIKDIEDQIVLDILEKFTDSVGGKFASRAHKLLSKIKNEDFNPIFAKLDLEDISDNLKDINLLEEIIKSKNVINCKYKFDDGNLIDITIQALKIVNFEGFWYLIAIDSKNGKLKKYYLKNISNLKIKDETFEIKKEIDELLKNSISIWFNQDTEPFEVKLFANKWAAKYFKRKPLSTQIIESLNEDGSMEFVIKITDEMEILPIVKYWLPYLKILEPHYLDDKIKSDIKKYFD